MHYWQRSTAVGAWVGWEAWCSADTNAVTALVRTLPECGSSRAKGSLALRFPDYVQVYSSRMRLLKLSHVISLTDLFLRQILEQFSSSKWAWNIKKSAAAVICARSTKGVPDCKYLSWRYDVVSILEFTIIFLNNHLKINDAMQSIHVAKQQNPSYPLRLI